jgi:hypothetical protein
MISKIWTGFKNLNFTLDKYFYTARGPRPLYRWRSSPSRILLHDWSRYYFEETTSPQIRYRETTADGKMGWKTSYWFLISTANLTGPRVQRKILWYRIRIAAESLSAQHRIWELHDWDNCENREDNIITEMISASASWSCDAGIEYSPTALHGLKIWSVQPGWLGVGLAQPNLLTA